jgi:hypothetical protein
VAYGRLCEGKAEVAAVEGLIDRVTDAAAFAACLVDCLTIICAVDIAVRKVGRARTTPNACMVVAVEETRWGAVKWQLHYRIEDVNCLHLIGSGHMYGFLHFGYLHFVYGRGRWYAIIYHSLDGVLFAVLFSNTIIPDCHNFVLLLFDPMYPTLLPMLIMLAI